MAEEKPTATKKGFFIAFEGADGRTLGKQAERLAEKLQSLRYEVILSREPGSTPTADVLRSVLMNPKNTEISPKSALCLFLASRDLHLREVILPNLEKGAVVILVRYEGSTFVYQHFVEGLDLRLIRQFNKFITGGLCPDLTIVLDLPAEESLRRRFWVRGPIGGYRERNLEFHQKVREGYLTLAKKLPRWTVIDATQTETRVASRIWKKVRPLLRKRKLPRIEQKIIFPS